MTRGDAIKRLAERAYLMRGARLRPGIQLFSTGSTDLLRLQSALGCGRVWHKAGRSRFIWGEYRRVPLMKLLAEMLASCSEKRRPRIEAALASVETADRLQRQSFVDTIEKRGGMGALLQYVLHLRGVTQAAASEASDVPRGTIAAIAIGDLHLHPHVALKLERGLRLPEHSLFPLALLSLFTTRGLSDYTINFLPEQWAQDISMRARLI